MSTGDDTEQNKIIYHEKQSRQLCALHTLNNLFQNESTFSKSDLDKIAETLSPGYSFFNPHKSTIGLGNYDVNVIIVALQNKCYEAIWFNKTKNPRSLELKNIFGFILNIANSYDFWKNVASFFTVPKRHWISVKKINSVFYNLDSKLKEPAIIGEDEHLYNFLQKNLENDAQIFVIVTQDVAKDNSWFRCD